MTTLKLSRTATSSLIAVRDDGSEVVTAFIVTTDTGYRAILPACPCDRIPCPKVADHSITHDKSLKLWEKRHARNVHFRERCHARHRVHAEAFARAVEKTYQRRTVKR